MIGPRPVVESELVEYGNQVNQFLTAKPGAMGLWQAKWSKCYWLSRTGIS